MSVKMDVEQGFLGENGPAQHTFIDLPVKKKELKTSITAWLEND